MTNRNILSEKTKNEIRAILNKQDFDIQLIESLFTYLEFLYSCDDNNVLPYEEWLPANNFKNTAA